MSHAETLQLTAVIAAAVVAGLLVLVGLPVWLGTRHARFERQAQHAERMKAMELGLAPAGGEAGGGEWTPAKVCVAMGVWVPLGVFGAALGGTALFHAPEQIWYAATAIGVAGIICGTIMMLRLPAPTLASSQARGSHPTADRPVPPVPKAAMDPDAYDTAGRRG